jgi:tetratricopeptide (TPR) repeat protein
MSRSTFLILLLSLLSVGLLTGGCNKNKKQQEQSKLEAAQRDVKQQPDSFDTAEEPPINADTHFAAGQLAESQGDVSRATKQYEEALKLDANHKNALFRLGAVYTQSKRFNEAIAIWQRYLKATNNSAAASGNLGLCYERAGRMEEAELAYKAGIARDPEDAACRINYGLMLARRDRLDEALAQLQTVLTPAEVHYNLGSVFEQQGKKEQAKAYYRKALDLDPKLADARSRLAGLK